MSSLRRHEGYQAAKAMLDACGVTHEVDLSGKHLKIRWQAPGLPRRLYVMAKSASDWRAVKNLISDLRRMLKADGLEPEIA